MTAPINRSEDPRRYYDEAQAMCGGESGSSSASASSGAASGGAAASGKSASTPSPAAPPAGKPSEPVSGQSSAASQLATAARKQKAPPSDPELCQRRLNTNDLLCKTLGTAMGLRLPGNAKVAGALVMSECVTAWRWLEENAPGGACGPGDK